MFFLIVIGVFFLAIVFFHSLQGLFSATISAINALLSVPPPPSPRLIQAWKTFSRRSRRDENCKKVSTEDRASVIAYLSL